MANCISIPLFKDKAKSNGTIGVTDFAFLGFKINEERDDILDTFFIFSNNKNDDLNLIKCSYILKGADDKHFLNSPLHSTFNLSLDVNKTILDEIKKQNNALEYYSAFDVDKIEDSSSMIHILASHTENEEQSYIKLILPLSIFIRIQIIKNRFIYNIPLTPGLDSNPAFDEIHFNDYCNIRYYGADYESFENLIAAFYVLRCDLNKEIGLISNVPLLQSKIITSKSIHIDKFRALYPNSMIINMIKIIITDWLDKNGNQCKKVCIYSIGDKSVSLYMISGDAKDCILMKPYEMVYNTNGV